MLVLSRHEGESIRIGDDIVVRILHLSPTTVRVGIEAPRTVNVARSELPVTNRAFATPDDGEDMR